MQASDAQGLSKMERVSSKRMIDKLFEGTNSRSLISFPIRLVYMETERTLFNNVDAQVMVSVPFLQKSCQAEPGKATDSGSLSSP